MRAVIVTEGGKNIGLGHIARCTALYHAFRKRSIVPDFIVNADDSARHLLKRCRYRMFNWLKEKNRLWEAVTGADPVIVDSYLAGRTVLSAIARKARRTVYLDDTNRLRYPTGLVVNGSVSAEKIRYPEIPGVRYLLGTQYFPLRDEFRTVSGKRVRRKIERVLVTFGGEDMRNMTPRVLRFLKDRYPALHKDVIIGKGFGNSKEIQGCRDEKTRFIYQPDGKTMRQCMLQSDIALCAGGQTLYECARAGLPAIAVCLADNQRVNLAGWKQAGFIEYIGQYSDPRIMERLNAGMRRLWSLRERAKRSRIGSSIIDGKGAERIIACLAREGSSLEEKGALRIRKAGPGDVLDLWKWRNHSRVRAWCFSDARIPYAVHKEWFFKKLSDTQCRIFILESAKDGKIGQVRLEAVPGRGRADINVNLNPAFIGRGWGSMVIEKATRFYLRTHPQIQKVAAEIIMGNEASEKVFRKAGYAYTRSLVKKGRKARIFIYNR